MKIEISPIFSERRASVDAYLKEFSLELSDKNNVIDIYFDNNDMQVENIKGLAYLIAQSHIALIVIHSETLMVDDVLTPNGEYILDIFGNFIKNHHYKNFEVINGRTFVYGMFNSGLVYTV